MFNFGAKEQVLSTALAGCAVPGYAKAGTPLIEEWNALTKCVDFQEETMKCARAGIAISGYAHASWRICACTETKWAQQNQYNINMPLNECEETDANNQFY